MTNSFHSASLSAVEGLHDRLAGAMLILADRLIDSLKNQLRRLP